MCDFFVAERLTNILFVISRKFFLQIFQNRDVVFHQMISIFMSHKNYKIVLKTNFVSKTKVIYTIDQEVLC